MVTGERVLAENWAHDHLPPEQYEDSSILDLVVDAWLSGYDMGGAHGLDLGLNS